jgi:TPR repeat protein
MKNFARLLCVVVLGFALGLATSAHAETSKGPIGKNDLTHLPLATLRHRAAHKDVAAEVELARRYGTGTGVKMDYAKAFNLSVAAAESGDAVGEFYVGTAYETGAGVLKDEARAAIWYGKAADQQQPDAAYALAHMIIEGRGGISPTWSGAIPLLEIAAKQDRAFAQILLGNAYATGSGIDKNPEQAAIWYRRAIAVTGDKGKGVGSARLRVLIERGDVKWQPGDPGEPQSAGAKDTPGAKP